MAKKDHVRKVLRMALTGDCQWHVVEIGVEQRLDRSKV
jgi:hypothetical protein